MGDNALKGWEWHNTEVGKGFQARGVVRQATIRSDPIKIIDMSAPREPVEKKRKNEPVDSTEDKEERKKHKKEKNRKEKDKKKRHKKEKSEKLGK